MLNNIKIIREELLEWANKGRADAIESGNRHGMQGHIHANPWDSLIEFLTPTPSTELVELVADRIHLYAEEWNADAGPSDTIAAEEVIALIQPKLSGWQPIETVKADYNTMILVMRDDEVRGVWREKHNEWNSHMDWYGESLSDYFDWWMPLDTTTPAAPAQGD